MQILIRFYLSICISVGIKRQPTEVGYNFTDYDPTQKNSTSTRPRSTFNQNRPNSTRYDPLRPNSIFFSKINIEYDNFLIKKYIFKILFYLIFYLTFNLIDFRQTIIALWFS